MISISSSSLSTIHYVIHVITARYSFISIILHQNVASDWSGQLQGMWWFLTIGPVVKDLAYIRDSGLLFTFKLLRSTLESAGKEGYYPSYLLQRNAMRIIWPDF